MSERIRTAEKARAIIADESSPNWQRAAQNLKALNGLEIQGLEPDVRGVIEAQLVELHEELSRHSIETDADYEHIDESDLGRLLNLIDRFATVVIAAELDRIVAELDAGRGKLPVEAIREAREHRELMIPRLIRVLRDAITAAKTADLPDGNAHFFAIFLLTEFRAVEAFPTILEAFSLPGELPFDLFGDAVTSVLARILAQFAGDRPELMDELIRNLELNTYVRWEAAQCYTHMVRDGRLRREEAVARLRVILRWAIDREDVETVSNLICVLASLVPQEAMADIRDAYERDLVDRFLIDLQSVEKSAAKGDDRLAEELRYCPPTGIEDTIEVLRHWAAFQERSPKRASRRHVPPPPPPLPVLSPSMPARLTPITRGERVGRNDPCPCGSGKKFKKCCGASK